MAITLARRSELVVLLCKEYFSGISPGKGDYSTSAEVGAFHMNHSVVLYSAFPRLQSLGDWTFNSLEVVRAVKMYFNVTAVVSQPNSLILSLGTVRRLPR